MNKTLSGSLLRMIFSIVLCASGISSALIAQTWTSIDGGGTYGISSTTAVYADYPSVAVFNGELYAIWQENILGEDQIHIKKYNGSAWSPVGNIAGQSQLNTNANNAWAPKIAACNGALYAAWWEYGSGITSVRVKKYDGTSWTFAENYTVGDGRTNINNLPVALALKVDITVFNNELYATWVETEPSGSGINQIRVAKFNGSVWTSIDGGTFWGINYNVAQNATNSTLCVFNNKLYTAWTETDASLNQQLRVKRYDGGSTWTFVDGAGSTGLNYNTSTTLFDGPVSLTSYDGKMYAFWTENNRIRAKRYDETNGWVADPADGGTGVGWCHTSTNAAYYPACYSYDKLYVIWEQNPIPRQVRVASYDGTTRTFIDGDAVAIGINNSVTNRGHFPKLIGYNGDLAAVWSEELNSTSGSANQIRAKIYPLPPIVKSVTVPANGTYSTGQSLNFTVNFSKNVVVSGGTPYIPITLNTGGTVNATYTGGTGTSTLTFSYSIVAGNGDPDGISVGLNIVNGGATLQSEDATPLSANLTLNNVGSTTGVLVDATGPTVTSVSSATTDGYYKENAFIVINLSLSEEATVTGTSTLALNSGGTASYVSGSGTTVLTFNYTVGSGQNSTDLDYAATNSLSLSGGTIKDGLGNDASLTLPTVGGASSLGGQKNIVIDNIAPSVTITSSATDPTNASVPVTITFSEPVTGFDVADIIATNGTKGALNGGPAIYTIDITPIAQGPVTVDIAAAIARDAADNDNLEAIQLSRTYDNTVPSVTVSSTTPDPTNSNLISVSIAFSEEVNGFDLSDISVGNAMASNLQTSDHINWTADITPISMGGFSVEIYAGVAQDLAGNNNTASGYFQRTYDPVAPTVTLSSSSTDPTNDNPIVVNIAFSETVFNLDLTDITVGNGTASNLQMLDYYEHWTVDIYPAANGLVTIDIPAGAAQDYATNDNIAATRISRTYVNLAPTVTTEAVTCIGTTTATGNGTLTDLGSSNPTAYGVCWNTTGTPTTADNYVDNGTAPATGAFTASMTSLSVNTTYYVRAYAINAADTSYGGEVSFTTLSLPTIAFTTTSSNDLESISSALLQVDLSAASGLPVTVDYTVTGTATGSGTDYTLGNGTLTIPAGDTSSTMAITGIIDDLLDEGDETIIVTLSNPVNATLGTNTEHTYVIIDNDTVTNVFEISKSNVSVYPNPFTNKLQFDNPSVDISLIIISDLSGKIVLKADFRGEKAINVNHLASGVYLLTLANSKGEKQTIKIVKE